MEQQELSRNAQIVALELFKTHSGTINQAVFSKRVDFTKRAMEGVRELVRQDLISHHCSKSGCNVCNLTAYGRRQLATFKKVRDDERYALTEAR